MIAHIDNEMLDRISIHQPAGVLRSMNGANQRFRDLLTVEISRRESEEKPIKLKAPRGHKSSLPAEGTPARREFRGSEGQGHHVIDDDLEAEKNSSFLAINSFHRRRKKEVFGIEQRSRNKT